MRLTKIRAGIALSIAAVAFALTTVTTNAATSCAVTTSSSQYAQAVAGTAGLVGYWRLGDGSASPACDSLGSSPGSYQGGVTLGVAGAIVGDPNTAASFDGSTGNVSVPASSSLNVGDSFTVEAWVKRRSIGGTENQVVASKQSSAWVLMFNPSNQLVLRQSGVADIAASTTTLTDTSGWHHVAVTKSGASVHLYIDGRDVTGTVYNSTLPDNTQPLAIGQSLSSAYFAGTLDEVALYKGALTAAQIQNHYTLGTTPPTTTTTTTTSSSTSTTTTSTPTTTTTTTTTTSTPTNPCAVTSSSSSYAQAVAGTSGIAGYWRLGDASGSPACDSLGKDPGSYQGGVTLGVAGAIGGDSNTAAAFDGSTGNASVPASTSLNVGDSFSVEAWVKRASVGGTENQVVASKQSSSWVLMFNPSNQLVLRQSGVADIAASTATVTDTAGWHHVAATKSGSSVHLYIDGKDVTGTVYNQTLPDNTQPLAIGQSLSSAYFKGTLDEVALYKGALSATQIQNHYSLGQPPPPPPSNPCAVTSSSSQYAQAVAGTSGIAGYWRLGDASGSAACDSLGKNPGSYQGGVTLGVAGAIAGDSNTAASPNGSTGDVSVPASAALNVGDSFTVEAWVKRATIGGTANQVVASKQDSSWVVMFNPSNQLVLRQSGVADIAASTATVTDTAHWHYVAVTKSGSAVHLYVDGKDVTGTVYNQTLPDNAQPLAIGESLSSAYFAGGLDEIALYKGALTATQVQNHYTLGAPAASADPTIAAAGDIACDPSDPDYQNGLGTSIDCQQMAVSNVFTSNLKAILALGDDQYDYGTLSAFNTSFGASWGRFKSIIHPIPGNHDYGTSGAQGYFDYFDGVGSSTGVAGDRSKGYYSFNVGTWHIIALNSNCSSVGGCGNGSAQETWLRNDLATHTSTCTLAVWHHPRWTSGGEAGGNSTFMSPIMTDLYNANADAVLSGHDHDYERFAPQNPSGSVDNTRGIREFVVGTGGESHHSWGTIQPNSQIRNNTAFGVLNLTLHSASYSWQFISAAGSSFSDSGTASCH